MRDRDMRSPRASRTSGLTFTLSLAAAAALAQGGTVREPFTWSGDHAATIHGGMGTTVWWNANVWDTRGDTSYPAIAPPATGYHVDVHRSLTADPTDGREDNMSYAVGGDGSPGVAAMRMDYQGISSARLRNPMLISPTRPGVVTFYATAFLTTAHWWEIAITPTATVGGAEQTAVPSVNDPLEGPFAGGSPTPGPGHRPALDSINVIATGSADVPCDPGVGWSTRFAVTRSIGGTTTDAFNPIASFDDLVQTDPSEIEELYLWRVEFRPNRIDLLADLDRNGTPELLEQFTVNVPWGEVYVHFMAVTYQADHHPQGDCYLGPIREFVWRDLSVGPVKYAQTLVFPKENGVVNVPRDTGWMSYDLRDIQRFGPAQFGVPQANPVAFDQWSSLLACSAPAGHCPSPVSSLNRSVDIPAAALTDVARAQIVYDIRSPLAAGTATLTVNGTPVAVMPGHDTVPGAAGSEWAHRSLDIPPALLQAGTNTIGIAMSGNVELDRLQVEIAVAGLFADDFEGGNLSRWSDTEP